MIESEHTAERPSWRCRVCDDPWPCVPAKRQLLSTLSPTRLAVQGLANLEEAARDVPGMPVGEAFARFVSWAWPENATAYEMAPE